MLHVLNRRLNAHLSACNIYNRIDEVEVWKLAIGAVVNDVKTFKPLLRGVVDGDGPLQGARLQREWRNLVGVVCVVIRVDPGLSASLAVGRHNNYYVLGPERPACGSLSAQINPASRGPRGQARGTCA